MPPPPSPTAPRPGRRQKPNAAAANSRQRGRCLALLSMSWPVPRVGADASGDEPDVGDRRSGSSPALSSYSTTRCAENQCLSAKAESEPASWRHRSSRCLRGQPPAVRSHAGARDRPPVHARPVDSGPELGPARRELRLEPLDDRRVHLRDPRLAQVERRADLLHRQFFIIIKIIMRRSLRLSPLVTMRIRSLRWSRRVGSSPFLSSRMSISRTSL